MNNFIVLFALTGDVVTYSCTVWLKLFAVSFWEYQNSEFTLACESKDIDEFSFFSKPWS